MTGILRRMQAVTKMVQSGPKIVSREEFLAHSPVKLIDEVILRAYYEKASDIHIEPFEHECRVRIRVDGGLLLIGKYKKEIHEESVARLKVLSSLRTDVRMSPQDGRFKATVGGTTGLSIRISIIPSFHGEKCVLRLLPQSQQVQSLENLGFGECDTKNIFQALSSPHGMILVVGPTGSGKTTTLYTLLEKVTQPDMSSVTLEDPIENSLPGITQIPIHANSHLTFVSALRSVVRQDPDVIMVGEIRDTPTAELATHAALTGHLLLSTLHTNDAIMALPRLIEMGVEPFLVASIVRAVVSQRLVRKICTKCVVERKITESEIEFLQKKVGLSDDLLVQKYGQKNVKYGKGCEACRKTGYSGRTVISEVLVVNEKIREMIAQKHSPDDMRKVAVSLGMTLLAHDAVEKVFLGKTTFEEISSVVL